jgi:hypothetical protein
VSGEGWWWLLVETMALLRRATTTCVFLRDVQFGGDGDVDGGV